MADFTALKTAIQTYIKQNGNEEITGDILQEILLSVVTTLGDSAINGLVTALADEVAARQNADGTLQQNITNEATARGNADTALGGRIDDEATARANGDTALSNRLGSSITAENTAADQIGAEAEARAAADTALQLLIDGITDNIENGYVYAGIATPSSTPATGKVFYLALTAGTYTNFGNTEVSQGINILKYNGSAWSLDAFIGIDDELTPSSNNLPKSGNVLENIIKNGSAFDLSAYNAVGGVLATYADLSAALTALNALPAVYKQGGMSFRFVRTSDNNYVQYRCMADEWSTDTEDWTIAEEGIYVENPEYIYVKTDAEGKVLWAIKTDGSICYGAGVPQQVKDYIEEKIAKLSLDEYEDMVAFLQDFLGTDTTLKAILDSLDERKVDKVENKGLIDSGYAATKSTTDNPEFLDVTIDAEGKVLGGRKTDGTKVEMVGFETPKFDIDGNIIENIQDPEGRIEIKTDSEDKVLSYRDSKGVLHENVGLVSPLYNGINLEEFINSVYNKQEVNELMLQLKGLKISWYGTSIPYSGLGSSDYPKLVGLITGATVVNEAMGSSCCRRGAYQTSYNDDPYKIKGLAWPVPVYGLMMSAAQRDDVISNWSDYVDTWVGTYEGEEGAPTNAKPRDINDGEHEDLKALLRDLCYDVRVARHCGINNPYNTKEVDVSDIYVIEHAHNDVNNAFNDISDNFIDVPPDPYDRNTPIGALNAMIQYIYEHNSRAIVLLIGHYECQSSTGVRCKSVIEKVAEYWSIPLLKLYDLTGFSQRNVETNGYWDASNVWHETGFSFVVNGDNWTSNNIALTYSTVAGADAGVNNNGVVTGTNASALMARLGITAGNGNAKWQPTKRMMWMTDNVHPKALATREYMASLISAWIISTYNNK